MSRQTKHQISPRSLRLGAVALIALVGAGILVFSKVTQGQHRNVSLAVPVQPAKPLKAGALPTKPPTAKAHTAKPKAKPKPASQLPTAKPKQSAANLRHYRLSWRVKGPGSVSVTLLGKTVHSLIKPTALKANSRVRLKAKATNGWFYGWVGSCHGSQPVCSLKMDHQKSVNAVFKPRRLPIRARASESNYTPPAKTTVVSQPTVATHSKAGGTTAKGITRLKPKIQSKTKTTGGLKPDKAPTLVKKSPQVLHPDAAPEARPKQRSQAKPAVQRLLPPPLPTAQPTTANPTTTTPSPTTTNQVDGGTPTSTEGDG